MGKKRVVSLLLAALMAVSMCGCEAADLLDEVRVAPADEDEVSDNSVDSGSEVFADAGIETDIPDLRANVASDKGLGKDAIVGTCLGTEAADDRKYMALVGKHFNAVTLENELKPDALFGYNNDKPGQIVEEEFNGETISVPKLDFSRADHILDKISEWNILHSDRPIKVRGHVLVWHSQTPEWFFHKDYDKENPYVSKAEMDKRLEWYIKSVMEYYTGPESDYKGLFYGWDVVNEAVSDDTGSYRTDKDNGDDQLTDSLHSRKSSWWKVYGSKEYIINAFKYANKYADPEVKLYYNDYNETDDQKMAGILTLLNDVKKADGARIDGFGMQAHYTVNAPSAGKIADTARTYSQAVGSVMLTELDVKTSAGFDGSDEKLNDEYNKMAAYYNSIYEELKTVNSEEDINIEGLTFWGAVDSYSWLNDANNVGGGADGGKKQCPLLFDGDYKAKPSFWAFVDASKIDMSVLEVKRETIEIKKGTITVDGEAEDAWDDVTAVPLKIVVGSVEVECETKLLWDEDNLYVLMPVKDTVLNDKSADDYQQDSIEVFIDENNGGTEEYEADDKQYRVNFNNKQSFNGEKCKKENIVSEAVTTNDGYMVEAAMKWTDIKPTAGTEIGLELQVNDATSAGERSGTLSWADDSGTCYLNPGMFGHAKLTE